MRRPRIAFQTPESGTASDGAAFDPLIAAVLAYVRDNLGRQISVAALAERFELSSRQLNRRFKAALGVAPSLGLRRLRVKRAAELLGAADLSVTIIAYECGFADSAHLARTFRREYGVTPKAFRQLKAGHIHMKTGQSDVWRTALRAKDCHAA